uniref:FBA_2 domain-containing protein n=1 Tax=Caenorhabditis tropicalis TaxID=1561998 RepID=A0A1I7UDQ8_9PELO
MTNEFTYPSLRCIWEYMEPNKRIHITFRSPELRRIDKSITLHIDTLQLDENRFKINDIAYEVDYGHQEVEPEDEKYEERPEEERLGPGDIQAGGESSWYPEITQLTIWGKLESIERQFPDTKPHVIAKKLANLFFEGRCKIVARTLQTREHEKILRLPVGFKVHTNVIKCLSNDFPYILPIVESSSKLTELETYVSEEETLDHPKLRNAKSLILNGFMVLDFMDKLVTLTNEYVGITNDKLSEDDIIGLIRYWINIGKPVGTVWEIACEKEEYGSLLKKLEEEFDGKQDPSDKKFVNKSTFFSSVCMTIPIDSKSQLVIGGIKRENPTCKVSLIRIESMPIELKPMPWITYIMNYVEKLSVFISILIILT